MPGNSPNDMSGIINAGAIAGALVAILTLVGMIVRFGVVMPLKAYIDKMTYAIQPHANGGKSLPDLINKVDALHVVLQNHLTTSHNTPISSTCLCKSDWHA